MSAKVQQVVEVEIQTELVSDKKVWASRKPGKAEVLIYTALLANTWVHQYRLTRDYDVNPASADKWLKRLHDHKFLQKRQAVYARRERFEYALTPLGKDFVSRRLEQHGLEEEMSASQAEEGDISSSVASPIHVEVAATRLLRLCSRMAVGNPEAQALVRKVSLLPSEAQKFQEVVALVEEFCKVTVHAQISRDRFEALGNHSKLSALIALPNGRIVTAGHDRAMRVWDRDPTEVPITIQVPESVMALAPLAEGADSFVSADVHAVRLWDLTSARPKVILRMKPSVTSALSVLTHNRLALADSSPLVQVVEMESGTIIAMLKGYSRYVHTLFPLEPNLLVGVSEDRLVVWDLDTQRPVFVMEKVVTSAAAVTSEVVAYAAQDYKVRLLNVSDGQEILTLKGHTGRIEHLVSIGKDKLVSAGADHQLKVWNTDSGVCVFSEKFFGSIKKVCVSGPDLIVANNLGDIIKLEESVLTP